MKIPEIIAFNGLKAGTNLAVFGAVHGNECCGPEAIRRVMALIEHGKLVIKAGTLTCVPVANPEAYARNTREFERNLNRFMFPKDHPQCYEDHLDNILCPVLERADALLDLHSHPAPGGPFIFLGPPTRDDALYARALGVNDFVHGFQNSYADPREAQGTTEYCRLHGGIAVTLECGFHGNEDAPDIGFNAILNALAHFGLADIHPKLRYPVTQSQGPTHCLRIFEMHRKKGAGSFAQDWQNMQEVKKGTLIGTYDDGEKVTAAQDGVLVMPKAHAKTGEAWFYFGVPSDYFDTLGL